MDLLVRRGWLRRPYVMEKDWMPIVWKVRIRIRFWDLKGVDMLVWRDGMRCGLDEGVG